MICTKCGEDKPSSEYYKKNKQGDLRKDCKTCHGAKAKKRYREDPDFKERQRVRSKRQALAALYGMSEERFYEMFEEQVGLCAICNLPMEKVCVDHCHTTGNVRGLLCGNCNTGLGMFKDNIEFMKRGVKYVKNGGRS